MATYEDDHNLPASSTASKPTYRRPRPDLSHFFSSLSLSSTATGTATPNSFPTISDIPSSAYTSLATAWRESLEGNEVLESLIEQLIQEGGEGKGGKGVTQEFLDGLERIPKKELVEADICPICNTPFLMGSYSDFSFCLGLLLILRFIWGRIDQYPLVVRLPCHKSHAFDLECISPWLKLHTTCPLDRIDVSKKKTPPPAIDDGEEEWDDNYG
ncbi:hypothetical protein ABW19_dt0204378 [Dactylella cylindrospora]|nr:hypothetical protein ABW19_dt0204378 [Dactylella cylindrospora]